MTTALVLLPPETDLARLRQSELAELLAGLPAATPKALSGHTWRGRALAPLGLEKAPRPLLGGLCALLATPLNPWRGKRFDGATGVNAWLGGAFTLGAYRLEERPSPVDAGPSCGWTTTCPPTRRCCAPSAARHGCWPTESSCAA